MKYSLLPLLSTVLLLSGCINSECRDCAAFSYDVATVNPDYAGDDLVFTQVDSNHQVTFERIQAVETPGQQRCLDVNSPDDIECTSVATVSYRNQDLGIDMLFGVEQVNPAGAGSVDEALFAYEFKDMMTTRFIRTHAVVVEPAIEFVQGSVERLDSISLGNQTFMGVLNLRQSAEAFAAVNPAALPVSGRFINLYLLEGVGLIGLRDINDRVYVRTL